LGALAEIARRAGAHEIAREAEALAERAREGRFYIVCVGQFKRGKSALVNALIGQPLLPTGVVPVTTAVTVVR
jgi:GTPase SAR1 family protein